MVIYIREKGDPLHEIRERKILILLFEVIDDGFELHQVFDPRLALDRVLILQHLHITGADEQPIVEIGNAHVPAFFRKGQDHLRQFTDALTSLCRKRAASMVMLFHSSRSSMLMG